MIDASIVYTAFLYSFCSFSLDKPIYVFIHTVHKYAHAGLVWLSTLAVWLADNGGIVLPAGWSIPQVMHI